MAKKKKNKQDKKNYRGYYIFDAPIAKSTVSDLIDWVDTVDINDKDVHLYLASSGGSLVYSHMAVQALNSKPNIIIHAFRELFSGGLYIFSECINVKFLERYFVAGMIHWPDVEISAKGVHAKDSNLDKIVFEDLAASAEKMFVNIKEVLNKTEINKYNAQKDLYLNAKRMQTITDKLNANFGWKIEKREVSADTE